MEEWTANDEKARSAVQLLEEGTDALPAADDRRNSVDWLAGVGHIAAMGLLARGRTDWKIAAMGKAEAKEAGRIAVLAGPVGQHTDMSALACRSERQVAIRSVASSDGQVHTAGRVHHANTLTPASGAGRGSESFHVNQPLVLRR